MSVSRRRFAMGLGALPLLPPLPSEAGDQPVRNSATETAPSSPKLFDGHELATVTAMAEVVIPATDTPGAREAGVAEYLDLILSQSPETARTGFLEGLWWTDGYARRSAGAPFKDLPAAEQLRILSELDTSSDESTATGRRFVHDLKTWTARIYYSTGIGHNELNKGGRVPAIYFRNCAG